MIKISKTNIKETQNILKRPGAGKFFIDKNGQIVGPKAYMESDAFRETKRRIENGTHPLLGAFPAMANLYVSICVICQTDYAAWKGMQEINRRMQK